MKGHRFKICVGARWPTKFNLLALVGTARGVKKKRPVKTIRTHVGASADATSARKRGLLTFVVCRTSRLVDVWATTDEQLPQALRGRRRHLTFVSHYLLFALVFHITPARNFVPGHMLLMNVWAAADNGRPLDSTNP